MGVPFVNGRGAARRAAGRATLLGLSAVLTCAPAASARVRRPSLAAPAQAAHVQSLPAFAWRPVRGAASYDFQFSADRRFSSGVTGFGNGTIRLAGTALTNDKAIPDGIYFWRVRGIDAKDHAGPWSNTRTLVKAWTTAPVPLSPGPATTVAWPTNPLVLSWTAVPYATSYEIYVASDAGLSNLVLGSVSQPQTTTGTTFAFPTVLPPGTYYWAVVPVDAENDHGPRSRVTTFTWTWPSQTATNVVNEAPSSATGLFDPQFSWDPVPGAASYQVELNTSLDFPAGSRLCCNDAVTGTSLSPAGNLPSVQQLYWRVRAIDKRGDAGDWNVGAPFQASFDLPQNGATVQNLRMIDASGNPAAPGATTSPILGWNPVAGASSYLVQGFAYSPTSNMCLWGQQAFATTTAQTAWTPLGTGSGLQKPNWNGTEHENALAAGQYCMSVTAIRDDRAVDGSTVVGVATRLGAPNAPAFDYEPQPTSANLPQNVSITYVTPAGGASVRSTPIFSWNAVPGANGYYVVVARTPDFVNPIDIGFTNTTAYAPRITQTMPLVDDTRSLYWSVIPEHNAGGGDQQIAGDPQYSNNSQSFTKFSDAPEPLSPASGSNWPQQPVFHWAPTDGARNYRLEVAGDASDAHLLLDVTTDSTAYTSQLTLPADRTIFWRVRANDVNNAGLVWSPWTAFTHKLPTPSPFATDPLGGEAIPQLSWTPVTGATSYDMHVNQADGSTKDFSVDVPTFTPTVFYGTGVWRWQVRAAFPGGATGAYFSPQMPYTRVVAPPTGVRATKSGSLIEISWSPDATAKQYRIELSATDGFGSTVAASTIDGTVWVPQITADQAKQTLFWRLAAVDQGGNVGAYATGVFHAPAKAKPKKRAKKRRRPVKHRAAKAPRRAGRPHK